MATKNVSKSENPLDQFSHLPDEAGVRLPTTTAVLACSNATVWRLAKAGVLKSIKVSARVTVFNVGSIRAVLNGGA
jgi:hypothetical protein